jgi:hypothetical protein
MGLPTARVPSWVLARIVRGAVPLNGPPRRSAFIQHTAFNQGAAFTAQLSTSAQL